MTDDIEFHVWPPLTNPGGQRVTDQRVAVLALHVPSGIAVVCESERSRHHNRLRADEMLRERLVQCGIVERPRPDPADGQVKAWCFGCGAELEP